MMASLNTRSIVRAVRHFSNLKENNNLLQLKRLAVFMDDKDVRMYSNRSKEESKAIQKSHEKKEVGMSFGEKGNMKVIGII